jgi:hypothetical protein
MGQLYLALAEFVATGYSPSMKNESKGAVLEKPVAMLDRFLKPVITLEKHGHLDAALDVLYDRVDDLLKTKQFTVVDNLLSQASVGSFSVDVLLGLLTATLPARSKLQARAKFFAEVEASIKTRGEWENGLLAGLES